LKDIDVSEEMKNKYDEISKELYKNGEDNEYKNYENFYNDFKEEVLNTVGTRKLGKFFINDIIYIYILLT
jgi:hypothetical protein